MSRYPDDIPEAWLVLADHKGWDVDVLLYKPIDHLRVWFKQLQDVGLGTGMSFFGGPPKENEEQEVLSADEEMEQEAKFRKEQLIDTMRQQVKNTVKQK